MKDINNNIDRVFREKLRNFQKQPPEEIWDGIKAGLGKKPRRKILIPLWQAAAGAALLITAGSIFYYLSRPVQNSLADQFLVVPHNIQTPKQMQKSDSPKSQTEKMSVANSGKERPIISFKSDSDHKKGAPEPTVISENIIIAENLPEIFSADKTSGSEFTGTFSPEFMSEAYLQPARQDAIPRNKKMNTASWDLLTASNDLYPEDTETNKRLLLTAQVSPTYSYRDIGNFGAGGSRQFDQYESGKISYSGGLQFGYKTSERLSIHTGLMYSQLGYNINQVESFYANKMETSSGTDVLSVPEGVSSVYAANNSIGTINPASEKGYFVGTNSAQNNDKVLYDFISNGVSPTVMSGGKIEQYFQYIELPFLLRYKIIDRKLIVNLVGGVSTNILVGNHVSLTSGDQTNSIGTSQDIRNFNYMGNMGLGFDYNLRKNLLFTMEPQFKYFLNSINQSNLISNRPYMLGMFTGVRFVW